MTLHWTLDPTPLTTWLDEQQIARGSGRAQGPIPITVPWGEKLEEVGATASLDAWSRVTDALTEGGLSREHLFGFAEAEDWEALHLAVLAWGYGRFGEVTKSKAAETFTHVSPESRRAVCEAAARDTQEAWNLWWPADRKTTLPGLRVAMGTKLLYFAGYESNPGLKPLIYDQRVHETLTGLGYEIQDPAGESDVVKWARDYGPYLQVCADAAEALAVEAEEIEFALFQGGL